MKDEINHDVPHIKVEVEFRGETISQQSSLFMPQIMFLCQAELAIRRGINLKERSVDDRVAEICDENMKKLLSGLKGKVNE